MIIYIPSVEWLQKKKASLKYVAELTLYFQWTPISFIISAQIILLKFAETQSIFLTVIFLVALQPE